MRHRPSLPDHVLAGLLAERFHEGVENPHRVVLCIADRLGWNRQWILDHVAAFDPGEAERVLQDFDELMFDQQRFVFVDGQPDVSFG